MGLPVTFRFFFKMWSLQQHTWVLLMSPTQLMWSWAYCLTSLSCSFSFLRWRPVRQIHFFKGVKLMWFGGGWEASWKTWGLKIRSSAKFPNAATWTCWRKSIPGKGNSSNKPRKLKPLNDFRGIEIILQGPWGEEIQRVVWCSHGAQFWWNMKRIWGAAGTSAQISPLSVWCPW